MAVQDQGGAVTILDIGRTHHGVEDQAEGVDEQAALLARDLLARVGARRVDARLPLSAPFTRWLSITQALGEATVLARPRRPAPEKPTGDHHGITNDSNESTSFRTDTKRRHLEEPGL